MITRVSRPQKALIEELMREALRDGSIKFTDRWIVHFNMPDPVGYLNEVIINLGDGEGRVSLLRLVTKVNRLINKQSKSGEEPIGI